MVTLFLADGFEEIEAICPIDILRRAGVEVKTCSITASPVVTGAHGIPFAADLTLPEWEGMPAEEEMLVLPGGMPGTLNLKASAPLCERILALNEKGALLAAICAAPTVFGHLGVLEGKEATCYPGMEDGLAGAQVTDLDVVKSKNVVTSRGAGTAFAFGLTLASLLKGEETAEKLSCAMCFKGDQN